MIPQYSILCTLLLCGTFLLSGKENSILPEKKTAVKSSAAFENGILEVQSNAKLGGVLLPVRCKAGTRVKIEFEAEGSGSIQYYLQSASNLSYSPAIPLREGIWKKISFSAFSPQAGMKLFIYSLVDGSAKFRLRAFKITEEPLPALKDVEVKQADFEAEDYPAEHGKKVRLKDASGGMAVWGKRWYEAAQIPVPATGRNVYLYLRLKKDTAAPLTVILKNGFQRVAHGVFQASGAWEWLRIGPVDPRAGYPALTVQYGCDAKTQVWLDRFAVSTHSELPEKDRPALLPVNGLTSAARAAIPPEIDGNPDDACWRNAVAAEPFILNAQNRFAKEQTSIRFAYDNEYLYVAFHCRESCLNPLENRLHEFKDKVKKNDDPAIYMDDCVLLLLKPSADSSVAYDFVINPNGAILDSRCSAPDFWETRDMKWSGGAKAAVSRGNGFWNVEMAIPFASLGVIPGGNQNWEIMAGRIEQSRNEKSAWQICEKSFHTCPLGRLVFTEQSVPFSLAAPPAFLPGRNKLAFHSPARVETSVEFPSSPVRKTFSDGKEADFHLNRNGTFSFRWSTFDPALNRLFLSPAYSMQARAAMLTHNLKNAQFRLNGETVKTATPLNNGMNMAEISGTPEKNARITVGGSEIPLAGFKQENNVLKCRLLLEDSVIWPNWEAKEICVNRGGIQQILFRPHGVKGFVLDDYTMYFDLPEGYAAEGASGYYKKWNLAISDEGTVQHGGKNFRRYAVRIANQVKYNPNLGSHEWIAFVFRAPEHTNTETGEFYFHAGSRKASIQEVPRRVAVRLYPKLNGARLKDMQIQMWCSWMRSMDSSKLQEIFARQFAEMGVNEVNFRTNGQLPYFTLINFEPWNFSPLPFLKKHPGTEQIDVNGKKVKSMICSGIIVKDPAFAAYMKAEMPHWYKRSGSPDDVMWDYESHVMNSYLSCFCPRCLAGFRRSAGIAEEVSPEKIGKKYLKEWTVYMNRKMADISGMFRDALQALPAKPSFSVYSGYENPDTNLVYGVNWEMLKGKMDRAACGYGRPKTDIERTRKAIGNTRYMLGAIAHPYAVTDRSFPASLTEATLLRRAADSNTGVLIYHYPSLDARTFSAIAAVSRILAEHEPFFRKHRVVEGRISLPGWSRDEYEVLSDEDGNLLVLLMNYSAGKKSYQLCLDGKPVRSGAVASNGAQAVKIEK